MRKLILVIVRDDSHDKLVKRLLDLDFGVTDFASIGGFLRQGSHTLMVGADEDRVEQALATIRETCPSPPDAKVHNATIFVINATQTIQI